MAEMTVSYLASKVNENNEIISTKPISFIEENGEILFTAEEIGRQLGFRKPNPSVNVLYNRNQKELRSYERCITVMHRDGKPRQTRCFTEEGAYIISMLAQTPNAREFRSRVAAMLREIRSSRFQSQLSLARESGYQQGFDSGRASVLPEVRKAQTSARAEAAGIMLSLPAKRIALLKKAVKYARMGLTVREVAKIVEADRRMVGNLISIARKNGLLPCLKRPISTQGNLLELAVSERKGA